MNFMKAILKKIDVQTNAFSEAFGHLSEVQLNWKPQMLTWSIAQNVEHLITINSSYFPILEKLKAGTLNLGLLSRITWFREYLGNTILKSVAADRHRKVKTFVAWQPRDSVITDDVLQRFVSHQQELKEAMLSCQDWFERGAIIHSPINKHIVYPLPTAFEIIAEHEARHFNQAKEVLAGMKSSLKA